jgi:hypothetical protein
MIPGPKQSEREKHRSSKVIEQIWRQIESFANQTSIIRIVWRGRPFDKLRPNSRREDVTGMAVLQQPAERPTECTQRNAKMPPSVEGGISVFANVPSNGTRICVLI